MLVGAPLPAHTRILCDGSELFPAELERWRVAAADADGDSGGASCSGGEGAAGADAGTGGAEAAARGADGARPAKRQRVAAAAGLAAGGGGRPQLHVGLWAPGERRLAEALLRFMYCGVLRLSTMPDLLRARPVALRLAIEGGVQACDDGVRASLGAAKAAGKAAVQAVLLDLYACRALLPDPDDAAGADPTGPELRRDVLTFIRAAVVQRCKDMYRAGGAARAAGGAAPAGAAAPPAAGVAAAAAGAAAVAGAGAAAGAAGIPAAAGAAAAAAGASAGEQPGSSSPPLGELLAFAFQSVSSILQEVPVRMQLLSLPWEAMEALLASEGFATDDEASVVLLLAHRRYWRMKNELPQQVTAHVQRLLRHIRWPHVSDAFLLQYAPHVPWLGMSWERAAWLSMYARATTPEQRSTMERAAARHEQQQQQQGGAQAAHEHVSFHLDAPGHRAPRRPAARSPGVRTCAVDAKELVRVQTGPVGSGKQEFSGATAAGGYFWSPYVCRYDGGVGVVLGCNTHTYDARQVTPGTAFPGKDVVLSVLDSEGRVAHSRPYGSANGGTGARIRFTGEAPLMLDLVDKAAEGEARWARYLWAGKLHIRVEFRS